MEQWLAWLERCLVWLEHLAPALALGAFLALVVVIVNRHGRRLERHRLWLERLDLRVGNLHKDRSAQYVRSIQIKQAPKETVSHGTMRPPPLSEAKTIEVDESMLITLRGEQKPKDGGKS